MTRAGTLVVVPTYDEVENIGVLVERLRRAEPDVHVLVVDDASPDGTGVLADRLAAADDHVTVLHRAGKDGLGAAYLAGFAVALGRGFDVVVEMDADGSHAPEELHRLLDRLDAPDRPDVVLGSRWVDGGSVVNWPLHRRVLSRGGSAYARAMLGVTLRDVTGGYRAYRADVLRAVATDDVHSHGYCFQIDMAWRALEAGFTVVEVPITFVERERGESKMDRAIVLEAVTKVGRWGVERRLRRR